MDRRERDRKEYMREYQLEWVTKRRSEWIQANGPCARCGSWDDLEVDHINPETKTMNPAQIWGRRKEARDVELAKCQVLCHTCHAQKTREDRNPGHGASAYARGCRCEICREGQKVRAREYRARKRLTASDAV